MVSSYLVNEVGLALNALYLAAPLRPLFKGGPRDIDVHRLGEDQRILLDRCAVKVASFVASPSEIDPATALSDILHSDDLYAVCAGAAIGSYDASRLRVMRGGLTPQEIGGLASSEARRFIERPEEFIVKDSAELARDVDHGVLRGEPHWDPVLRASATKKIEFLKLLHGVGLLTWRRQVKCRVGCFFVKKKENMLRLVIDARWTNRMCRSAPYSRLAVPSALSRLCGARGAEEVDYVEMLAENPANTNGDQVLEEDLTDDGKFYGYSVDLTDGFYQFKSEKMAAYFGLGVRRRASELEQMFGCEIREVFCSERGGQVAVGPNDSLECCFLGMAMGWSWALFFCHDAVSEAMKTALLRSGLPPVLVGDIQRPAYFNRAAPALAPYVDNANVIAQNRKSGDRVFHFMVEELSKKGFVLRDEICATTRFEFLGMVLDGDRGVLHHTPRRTWRLWMALTRVLQMGKCTGDALRVLAGHLCHHFGLLPPALSILEDIFPWALSNLGRMAKLTPTLAGELRACRALLFVVEVNLRREFGHTVFCSDASTKGYALHQSPAAAWEVAQVCRWRERWRFKEVLLPSRRRAPLPNEPVEAPSEIADEFVKSLGLGAARLQRPARDLTVESGLGQTEVVVEQIPAVPDRMLNIARWCLIVAGGWKHASKIHLFEAKTALMGLRRALGRRDLQGRTLLSLGDNLSEILAMERGRATNRALNSLCRQSLSMQVFGDITWRRRHVVSKRNISDADSRRADAGEIGPGEVVVPRGVEVARAAKRASEVVRWLVSRDEEGRKFSKCGGRAGEESRGATVQMKAVMVESGPEMPAKVGLASFAAGDSRVIPYSSQTSSQAFPFPGSHPPASSGPRFFLEIFAGSGRLSGAVAEKTNGSGLSY